MRSKVLISVFVAFAILFSFGMAEKASADSIMFPWIVKSDTVFTLVSVVNMSETSFECTNPQLHYQYYYKPDTLTDSCEVQSFYRKTSQEDIVSFDASGSVSSGAALFNDQPPINGNVTYIPNWFHMNSAPTPARAFLLVDNNDDTCFPDADYASMYGEAMVMQITQGSAWGYVAYNGAYGGPGGPGSEPELAFNDELDVQGEVLRSPRFYDYADENYEIETTPTVLLPLSTFITKMFVTPVNYALYEYESGEGAPAYTGGPGVRTGDSNSRIQFCLRPLAQGDFPLSTPCTPVPPLIYNGDNCQNNNVAKCEIGGIYDNDEAPLDSNIQPNVVCTAAIDIRIPGLILTQAQIDYLTTNPGGQGWTYVRSMVGSYYPFSGLGVRDVRTMSDSIVGKLDYTEAPAGFVVGDRTIGGTVNDFKWIRNSASQNMGDWDLDRAINTVGEESWDDAP
jgi:hypothetical protein